jgi:hypothetical protein
MNQIFADAVIDIYQPGDKSKCALHFISVHVMMFVLHFMQSNTWGALSVQFNMMLCALYMQSNIMICAYILCNSIPDVRCTCNSIWRFALLAIQYDAVVWIHDYHLLLVPSMIRTRLPHAIVGFFLHTVGFFSYYYFPCLILAFPFLRIVPVSAS